MRSKTRTGFARTIAVGSLLIVAVAPVSGQATMEQRAMQLDVYARTATRADLEALVEPLQQRALESKDRDEVEALRVDLAWLSYRLREGDIWEGDVISLAVAGETDWTNNFTVSPVRTLVLDGIKPVPVSGVLYSELESHLTQQLSTYLREPRVHAEALKRIAVLGGVGNPGFMSVSGSTIVSDLIMQAGGPSAVAELDKAEFKRAGKKIGFDTGGPIAFQAYSLDQLGIRSGDELHVPQNRTGGRGFWFDFRIMIAALGGLTVLATRIF